MGRHILEGNVADRHKQLNGITAKIRALDEHGSDPESPGGETTNPSHAQSVRPQTIPALLIIEGDAARMTAEGHATIADDIERTMARHVAEGRLRFRRVRLRSAKDVSTWSIMAKFARYDGIVLLGHGNERGVVAAPDVPMTWHAVGDALAPLYPRALLTVSCFGGMAEVTDTLFAKIPSLQVITGSPAALRADQAQLALLDLLLCIYGVELHDVGNLMLVVNGLMTEGVVFRRTREGLSSSSYLERVLLDHFGQAAAKVLPHLF